MPNSDWNNDGEIFSIDDYLSSQRANYKDYQEYYEGLFEDYQEYYQDEVFFADEYF